MPVSEKSMAPGDQTPPVPAKSTLKRKKSVKKKAAPHMDDVSPLKRQLEETEIWTKIELDNFTALPTAKDRVQLVYDILPDDATGLDRLWPIRIQQKDSR